METIRGFQALPTRPPVILAIGVFDGVHLGHRRIIGGAVTHARRLGILSVVLTFEPHPAELFGENGASRLAGASLKERFIDEIGPDYLLVANFDRSFAALEPDDFIRLLLDSFILRGVVVGANFHYGSRASGTPRDLVVAGDRYGFEVDLVPLLEVEGEVVSSTRIRRLLQEGSVEKATRFLGRSPVLAGEIIHGRGRGSGLGIHTANIAPECGGSVPGSGVYAGRAKVGEDTYPAAISVGTQPTFASENAPEVCEVHLIGYEGDLYGTRLEVDICARLRDQERFAGPDELVAAIREDIRRTVILVGAAGFRPRF